MKEIMLHSLFDKSRLQNSELLATGINLVIQLLTSFEGKQMYRKNEKKEQVFADATENRQICTDGIKVENGRFIALKRDIYTPVSRLKVPKARRTTVIQNNILMEDK
ncbi:MAG: hypothetical protein NC205_06505 [Prevotella sp.]|nr:hypothetical protein [Alistipes senegalensis]MCM1358228.1 hypothetical protein [Prevotella sp.]